MSEETAPTSYITLHTDKDNGTVQIDIRAVKKSKVLADMIKNLEIDINKPDSFTEGPVCPVGTREALEKINDWIVANHDKPPPAKISEHDKRCIITEEDAAFMDVKNALLVEILALANFLDIDDLMELITQKIANMIKDKTPDQLRKLFMLPDDLTPDEKADIRAKHSWATDGRN